MDRATPDKPSASSSSSTAAVHRTAAVEKRYTSIARSLRTAVEEVMGLSDRGDERRVALGLARSEFAESADAWNNSAAVVSASDELRELVEAAVSWAEARRASRRGEAVAQLQAQLKQAGKLRARTTERSAAASEALDRWMQLRSQCLCDIPGEVFLPRDDATPADLEQLADAADQALRAVRAHRKALRAEIAALTAAVHAAEDAVINAAAHSSEFNRIVDAARRLVAAVDAVD